MSKSVQHQSEKHNRCQASARSFSEVSACLANRTDTTPMVSFFVALALLGLSLSLLALCALRLWTGRKTPRMKDEQPKAV